jgi:hypothetical protein
MLIIPSNQFRGRGFRSSGLQRGPKPLLLRQISQRHLQNKAQRSIMAFSLSSIPRSIIVIAVLIATANIVYFLYSTDHLPSLSPVAKYETYNWRFADATSCDPNPYSAVYPKKFFPDGEKLDGSLSQSSHSHNHKSEIKHKVPAKSGEVGSTWDLSLTPKGGFLHVQEPIGPPRQYGVSMFHQLHCLDALRAALLGGKHHHEEAFIDELDDTMSEGAHLVHCIDYIAQVSSNRVIFPFFEAKFRLLI